MNRNSKGIISWFVYNPIAANLLMAVVIFLGIVSLFTMKRSLAPDVDLSTINITVPYPGASSHEIEKNITIKIEEKIRDIDGVSKFYSVSGSSKSVITIDVADGFNVLEILDKVQGKVDGIKTLPKEVDRPVISREQSRRRVLIVQIFGDMDERGMKILANDMKMEMLQDNDISSIDVLGTRPYEINIEVSESDLQKYQLNISHIANAIKQFSVDIPGGSIKTVGGDILLRTTGHAYNQYDFEEIVIKSFPDSRQVVLGDVANIHDGFTEVEGYARFDGKPSVALSINAVGEQSIQDVAAAVNKYVGQKKNTLPDDVSVVTWADVTFYLEKRIDMMYGNLMLGALMVFLVLGLFLDLKLAFWVMAGLPVCFLGALAVMPVGFIGVSLNMVSLFGFLLVLGVVVDDAIIVGEAVHAQVDDYGMSLSNVVEGVKSVAIPATFGVLTTIVAFTPTIFVSGPFSAIPQAIGYVVTLCLIFSLVESKLILPAHLGRVSGRPNRLTLWIKPLQQNVDDLLSIFVELYYRPILQSALKQRYVCLSLFVSALILTTGLFTSGLVRLTIFPDMPSDFLISSVEMIEDSSDQQLRDALSTIEKAFVDLDRQYKQSSNNYLGLVQHSLVMSESNSNGSVMIELVKSDDRSIDSFELVDSWRDQVGEIAGVKSLKFLSFEDANGPPLAFKIISDNSDQREAAANELQDKLRQYNGVVDIKNESIDVNDEIHLKLKPSAFSLGLTLSDLGVQVREAFYGAEAQRIQRGNDEVKVMVRYPAEERQVLSSLENMYVTAPDGSSIPFLAVAEIELKRGHAKNTRINGASAVTVAASVDKGKTQPSTISNDIMNNFSPLLEKRYPAVKIKLDGVSIKEQDTIRKIFLSLLGALVAIYVLLAIPLGSYTQPLIIMVVIPFGIIGAVLGHLFLDQSVNMLSFFGMIALSGVVVNDSLVLVDFVNKAKCRGLRTEKAVVDACVQRFRAILITSLTTVAGLLPMLFEGSRQAQLVIPMAISLSFGIVFATAITLLLIPCLYVILQDIKDMCRKPAVFQRSPDCEF